MLPEPTTKSKKWSVTGCLICHLRFAFSECIWIHLCHDHREVDKVSRDGKSKPDQHDVKLRYSVHRITISWLQVRTEPLWSLQTDSPSSWSDILAIGPAYPIRRRYSIDYWLRPKWREQFPLVMKYARKRRQLVWNDASKLGWVRKDNEYTCLPLIHNNVKPTTPYGSQNVLELTIISGRSRQELIGPFGRCV